MTMIPSNLGQILGQLLCEQGHKRRRSSYRIRALKSGGVAGTIRKALRELGTNEAWSTLEIAECTEPRLTVKQVQTNIPYMPDVERFGAKRPYGYRIVE